MRAVFEPLPEGRLFSLSQRFVAQALLDAHYLFHKPPVDFETRQQRQDAIPVEQVVEDAPAHEAEHVAERLIVRANLRFRHTHQAAELAVYLFVSATGE